MIPPHVHGHGHPHFRTRRALAPSERTGQFESLNLDASESLDLRDSVMRIMARQNVVDEKPSGDPNTTTIAISVVIPLLAAIIGLAYFARKGVLRRRREEATNKFKSLDFGLQETALPKTNKRKSKFFGMEKDPAHKAQLSMDINLSSPYLLPPNLQNSRESFNSLAKTLHQNDDPYRNIADYAGSDGGSLQSLKRGPLERTSSANTSKTLTAGDSPRSGQKEQSTSPVQSPAPVAQPFPHSKGNPEGDLSMPVNNEFRFVDDGPTIAKVPEIQEPPVAVTSASHKPAPPRPASVEPKEGRQPMAAEIVDQTGSPREESMPVTKAPGSTNKQPSEQAQPHAAGLAVPGKQNKRLSVGLRPLPPDEFLDSEDPEFRAMRIRSFYKEYFDDGKVDQNAPPVPKIGAQFGAFDQEAAGNAPYFDPETNTFVMPYAQPVTRRAMTPPPKNRRPMPGPRERGPPGPRGPHGGPRGPGGPGGRPRAGSTISSGGWGTRSPRPSSSASNPRHGGPHKKLVPPPTPLNSLPSPSMLKDDSLAILGAIDFAPPPSIRDHAAGRSQSPHGERLPFKAPVPAPSPLISAFEDTPVLPSPHLLRKSGAFTGLDFAPPRRFKEHDGSSEVGSVASSHGGISGPGLSAIRAGAGRVSRLPGDVVFTQSALSDNLKPNWDMNNVH